MTGWTRTLLLAAAALTAVTVGPPLTPQPALLPVAPPDVPPDVPPDAPPDAPPRPLAVASDGAVPAVWVLLPPLRTTEPDPDLAALWPDLRVGSAVVGYPTAVPRLLVPPGGDLGDRPPSLTGGGPDGGPVGALLDLGADTALSWRSPELVVWSPVLTSESLRRRRDTADALQRAEAGGVTVTIRHPSPGGAP